MTTGTPYPMDPQQPGDGSQSGGPGSGRSGGPNPPPRRGANLMPLIVVGWALLEIWLLILIGDAAGGMTVFLLLLGGVLIGTMAIKRAGRRAWQQLAENIQQQQAAARTGTSPEPVRGGGNGLTMLGGLLLIIPGPLSDLAGLLCIFPPTAALLRSTARRMLTGSSGPLGTAYQDARRAESTMRARRPDGKVVQGEVVDRPNEPETGGTNGELGPDSHGRRPESGGSTS